MTRNRERFSQSISTLYTSEVSFHLNSFRTAICLSCLNHSMPYLVYPTLSLFVNNVPVSESDTIELLYNQSYTISCSSVGSKPDVSLSMFDTNTNLSLSNGQNNITTGSCDPNTLLCNQILQIVFSYDSTNNLFDQMTSITCLAESKQPDLYPLSRSIARNVNVVLPPPTTTTSPVPMTSTMTTLSTEAILSTSSVITSTTGEMSTSTGEFVYLSHL